MRSIHLGVCVIAVLLSSCATTTQVRTMTTLPAKYGEVTKLRRIAVMPFDGHHGREITSEIESQLVSAKLEERSYFTVIERARIDRVLSELKLSNSALVDDKTAVKIGKMLGVQAMYMGLVRQPKVSDSHFTEQRSVCSGYVTKYDKKGKPYETCGGISTYNVSCTRRIAELTVIPKVVEVETGRIIYATTISEPQVQSACSDKGSLKSGDEMIDDARRQALSTFRKHVAPYTAIISIVVMEERDGMSNAAATRFESGLEYAKANRLDRACELWNEAVGMSPKAVALVYSRGICEEVSGNYRAALESYRDADRILNKPHPTISSALHRVQKQIDDQAKLTKQARSTKP